MTKQLMSKAKVGKAELIESVAGATGYSQAVVREVFDAIRADVESTLAMGHPVLLLGLGKLSITRRGARSARNLHTGATVLVPARNAVLLRPSASLLKAVNA